MPNILFSHTTNNTHYHTHYTAYSLQPNHKSHTLPKPDINTPHHNKKKGAQWRGLTPAAKKEWQDAEAKAKEVFDAASK